MAGEFEDRSANETVEEGATTEESIEEAEEKRSPWDTMVENETNESEVAEEERPDPSTHAKEPHLINLPVTEEEASRNRAGRFSPLRGMQGFAARERTESWESAEPIEESADEIDPFHRSERAPIGPTDSQANSPFGEKESKNHRFSSADEEDLLVTNRTPRITYEIRGPRKVLIGREAVYRLQLRNEGDVAADELVANIHVPSWADVVDTLATNGILQRAEAGHPPSTLRWQMHQLAPGASETLELKLIPRSSRPLEVGVHWTHAPVDSRAVVEVQEPKLRMHVSGPDEVLFGKPQLYRLTLTNPGTGTAEDVKIELMPPGGGEESVSSHQLGDLQPGTSKSVEVELTAREAGKLFVKASALAEGGLVADASKEIFCRKPELEVDWRGPETKYAGTTASYFFRVRNPGTATAEDVLMRVSLPEGVELINASEGQTYHADQNEVVWRVGSLRPGDDYYMELKCKVHTAGRNQFRLAATTAAKDLSSSEVFETNVVALADLKLAVSDPQGPVPVGEEAIYEIRVKNRGTNTAEDVNILALFSDGIEPLSVEGAQYSVTDGRVTFRTIEKLLAGRQIVLRIRTRATKPGTHIFRAEVLCRDLEIKLAAEESTRFFEDEMFGSRADMDRHSASRAERFETSQR